jgi:uncharacterized membrane protein
MSLARHMSRWRLLASAAPFALAALLAAPAPARADLKLCNSTSSRIGIAIGYKDTKGWTTEGWWNVASHSCETVLKGKLIARYYYVHAVDYDRGGEWRGSAQLCTDDKAFTIKGEQNCTARGYKTTRFFEVDTGEEQNWTVRLVDPAEGEAKSR